MQPNVETFIGCDSSYRATSIVLYGAPYDSTTSYRPGARFGPAAIRHESYGLETYSPYQNADLTDFDVFDSGDLELCFGSSESALADIEARAEEILHDGKFPLLLGGEHLVTLGAVRAVAKKYPDLHIVHFDAHADLRDDYLGAKLSHACVLRRCHELVGDGHIHQFCIRSGDRTEFEFAAQHTDAQVRLHRSGRADGTTLRKQSARVPDHRPRLSGPVLLPRNRYPRSGRRELFAAAGCHPHRDKGKHRGCRPQRAGSDAGHYRRLHGYCLQGAARTADRTG